MSYHNISYHIISYHVISCHEIWYDMLWNGMVWYVTKWNVGIVWDVMWWDVLWHNLSCTEDSSLVKFFELSHPSYLVSYYYLRSCSPFTVSLLAFFPFPVPQPTLKSLPLPLLPLLFISIALFGLQADTEAHNALLHATARSKQVRLCPPLLPYSLISVPFYLFSNI